MNADAVTYIGFVQDHSGSMTSNKQLAVDNFNEQLATLLKEDDDTMDNLVTIIEFDDQVHCNIDNTPINQIKKYDKWWTGGMTALYDAIAHCIKNIEEKMKNESRDDCAALIVIQTDGHENYSSDYAGEEGRKKINEKINKLEDTGKWTFVFLGENIDKEVAMDLGFKASNILSHKSGEDNVRYAYSCSTGGLGRFMSSRKAGDTQTFGFYNDNDTKTNKSGGSGA